MSGWSKLFAPAGSCPGIGYIGRIIMTTSMTSTSDKAAALGKHAQQASASRTRSSRMMFVAISGVLAIGAFALFTRSSLNWLTTNSAMANFETHTVGRETFNVDLIEKGEMQAAKSTDIISEVEGQSTIIWLIPEGTPVKKGDLLVELASDKIDDRVRQEELKESNAITAYESAQAELEIQQDKNASDIRKGHLVIELAQIELEKYEKGEWMQKQKDANIAIDQAQMLLERREQDFKAADELLGRGFITQTEYDEDEFNHSKAIWDLEKAKNAKLVLSQYTHIVDLRRRQSDLEEAQKELNRIKKNAQAEERKKTRNLEGNHKELDLIQDQLANLRQQKKNCRLTASAPGFVVYYSGGGGRHMMSGSQIKEGETVYERQIIMQIPDTSEMVVKLRVHEAKTNKLAIGQRAIVEVEGLPGKQFNGRVNKIAAIADTQNRWLNPDLKEYETEVLMDETTELLKPGVTAHVRILVETIENQPAVPVQAVFTKGPNQYVFVSESGSPTPKIVQLGAIGTDWAQINSGVNENDKVLLAFDDKLRRLISTESATADASDNSANSHRPAGEQGQKKRGGRRPGSPGKLGASPGAGNHEKAKTNAKPSNHGTPS